MRQFSVNSKVHFCISVFQIKPVQNTLNCLLNIYVSTFSSVLISNPYTVFCPGLKKGMVLLAEKGHFCSRNYILRALSHAKLHFEGTFAREITF